MKQIIELVHEVLDQEPMSAEEKLQLKKICELEDAFTKGFSKEKWRDYFNIDLEKSALSCIEIDKAIEEFNNHKDDIFKHVKLAEKYIWQF